MNKEIQIRLFGIICLKIKKFRFFPLFFFPKNIEISRNVYNYILFITIKIRMLFLSNLFGNLLNSKKQSLFIDNLNGDQY
jgi:hypothetical protein